MNEYVAYSYMHLADGSCHRTGGCRSGGACVSNSACSTQTGFVWRQCGSSKEVLEDCTSSAPTTSLQSCGQREMRDSVLTSSPTPSTGYISQRQVPTVPASCVEQRETMVAISNEITRHQETRPAPRYMERLARAPEDKVQAAGITADMRAVAVSWLVEVATAYRLQQETMFLAVNYMDRFLSVWHAVPRDKLQLVAVACMSVAAKQHESEQPSAQDWAAISQHCFQVDELFKAERLVLDNLEWRLRVPTTLTFLDLYCHGVPSCGTDVRALASFLLELSLLDVSLLALPASATAAAALLLAHRTLTSSSAAGSSSTGSSASASAGSNSELLLAALLGLAPMDAAELTIACQRLRELHRAACAATAAGGGGATAGCSQQQGELLWPVIQRHTGGSRVALVPAL